MRNKNREMKAAAARADDEDEMRLYGRAGVASSSGRYSAVITSSNLTSRAAAVMKRVVQELYLSCLINFISLLMLYIK